jgi:hypothetical protein
VIQGKVLRISAVALKPPRKFVGVVLITSGLPACGKSQIAHYLIRRLNWNGESAKGEKISNVNFIIKIIRKFIIILDYLKKL